MMMFFEGPCFEPVGSLFVRVGQRIEHDPPLCGFDCGVCEEVVQQNLGSN